MTGRERVAQIIRDELRRQASLSASFVSADNPNDDVNLEGGFDLLAVVDALVAATPAAPPVARLGSPIPSMVTKLWERREADITRIEQWPEGMVLWHNGEIVWRQWPKAPEQNAYAPPETLTGAVDALMDFISETITEADVDEPAGKGSGYRVDYDEAAIRTKALDLFEMQAMFGGPRPDHRADNGKLPILPATLAHSPIVSKAPAEFDEWAPTLTGERP